MLRFKKFQKRYGSYLALKVGDLSIPPGVFWIKGANGSGKSTLLKTIAGILAFQGDIILDQDLSVKKKAVSYRAKVNFAEAEPLFPDFLTGRELLTIFEESKGALAGNAEEYLQSMAMQDYMDRPIGSYSSGMVKKLSLVLAFIGTPKLILLDEPLITLDAASLQIFYSWVINEHEKHGTSFMLSSHQSLDPMLANRASEILIENQTLKLI